MGCIHTSPNSPLHLTHTSIWLLFFGFFFFFFSHFHYSIPHFSSHSTILYLFVSRYPQLQHHMPAPLHMETLTGTLTSPQVSCVLLCRLSSRDVVCAPDSPCLARPMLRLLPGLGSSASAPDEWKRIHETRRAT
ncbi:hypothetical protein AB205_0112820 [Aquarana catesbeiana]|uniref:Uncharacterized protein n=1 Tax=Aquarana catesbeiana TaxID=8400 RepID=A0A2G9Q1Z9_AQUCT|nr:hypothetical protein AB205_0112820 [Aquarana catesbeiana]